MKDYLLGFMEYCDYPSEARAVLSNTLELLYGDSVSADIISGIISEYGKSADMDYSLLFDGAAKIAQRIGISRYTVELLAFILLTRELRRRYFERGFSEDTYCGAVLDLKWKLLECYGVKGVWGTFVGEWLCGWFRVARFTFGRLQYEISPIGREYVGQGVSLKPEDEVVFVHIPRTLEPLLPEAVDRSLLMAKEFFADKFKGGRVVFCCSSWMLYPENRDFLSPKSNTAKFAARFEIIASRADSDGTYPNAWRVFNQEFLGDTSVIVPTTRIAADLLSHYARGGKMGTGFGVLVT